MFSSLTRKMFIMVFIMLFGLILMACNEDMEHEETVPTGEDPLEVFAVNYYLHNSEPKVKNFRYVSYSTQLNDKEIEKMYFKKRVMYGEVYADYLFCGTLLSYKSEIVMSEEFISSNENTISYRDNITFLYKDNYLYIDHKYTLEYDPLDAFHTKTKNFTYGDKKHSENIKFDVLSEGFYGNNVDVELLREKYDSIILENSRIVCVYERNSSLGEKITKTIIYYYDENYQIFKIEYCHCELYFPNGRFGTGSEMVSDSYYKCIELSSKLDFDVPEEFDYEVERFKPIVIGAPTRW